MKRLFAANARQQLTELIKQNYNHLSILFWSLFNELHFPSGAKDPKDVLDLQARLAAEQSYIQGQGVQAQTLAMMQVASYQERQQERDEQRQKDIDAVLAADPDR